MAHRVITANRLRDGAVVWLDASGEWVDEIGRAMSSDDDDAVAAALESAKAMEAAGHVIGVYEVEVQAPAGGASHSLQPVRLRERIRADGPTVAFR